MASDATNVTPILTKAGENINEIIFQLFESAGNIYSDLTRKFLVKGNNDTLVAYHYAANSIQTTQHKNRTRPCILNGITKTNDKFIKRGLTPNLNIIENEV